MVPQLRETLVSDLRSAARAEEHGAAVAPASPAPAAGAAALRAQAAAPEPAPAPAPAPAAAAAPAPLLARADAVGGLGANVEARGAGLAENLRRIEAAGRAGWARELEGAVQWAAAQVAGAGAGAGAPPAGVGGPAHRPAQPHQPALPLRAQVAVAAQRPPGAPPMQQLRGQDGMPQRGQGARPGG
jgi:hypothetical protein